MGANERIKKYMDENGIQYSFVAKRAGIDKSKFSRFMTCKQAMTTDEYEIICKNGLKVEPSFFYKKQ